MSSTPRRRRRTKPVRPLRLERLEERIALAVVRWDGDAADGQWTNRLNWVGDALPGELDDVEIGAGGEVTHAGAATFINSLVSDAPLRLTGGSLEVTRPVRDDDRSTPR